MAIYWLKIVNFLTPLSFHALARGERFRISGWTFCRQNWVLGLSVAEDFDRDPSLRRFDTVPACDRQTDRQTDIPTV